MAATGAVDVTGSMRVIVIVIVIVIVMAVILAVRVIVAVVVRAGRLRVVRSASGSNGASTVSTTSPMRRSISASTWSGSSCSRVGVTSSGTCRLPRW